LVDDDHDTLQSMADALGRYHEISIAYGVAQAFARLSQKPVPDVVITDYHMPPNRGDQLLLAVAVMMPRVGRILHTASPREELKNASAWAHRVLHKGCGLQDLLGAIRQSLVEVGRWPARVEEG
jgi:DNA-binding NtrC family response regulator